MILSDFKAFPRTGRIMAVDWGAARVGIAVTDESREFFFTRPAIFAANVDVAPVIAHAASVERVVGIIVGLPLHADGSPSDTTTRVREFAARLAAKTDLPICFVEENLTSASAQDEIGARAARQDKAKLDSVAARIILENAVSIINRI